MDTRYEDRTDTECSREENIEGDEWSDLKKKFWYKYIKGNIGCKLMIYGVFFCSMYYNSLISNLHVLNSQENF